MQLSEPMAWVQDYRKLRLMVRCDPRTGQIHLPVGDFAGAVTMPAYIGRAVRSRMEAAGLPVVIVDHPRSQSWTFLADSHSGRFDDMALYAKLFRYNVRIAPPGGSVALPSPHDAENPWRRWEKEPSGELPPMDLLVGAVVQVTTV